MVAAILSIDIPNLTAPECVIDIDYEYKWLLSMIAPIVLLLPFAYLISNNRRNFKAWRVLRSSLQFICPFINTVTPWNCTRHVKS